MNKKGSVLVVTLGFIMVFSMLGVGSIYHASMQNVAAEKRRQSMEAFWLAEGGVEKAKTKLRQASSVLIPDSDSPVALGHGTYDVYSMADPGCPLCLDRWLVHSEGLVKNQPRTIEVIMAKYDIDNVLMTQGPIKDFENCPMASVGIDCSLVEENVDFSFESVLNGTSQQDIVNNADYTYTDPQNAGDVDPIAGITVIYLTGNNASLSLTTDNQTATTFLLIDTTQVTSNSKPNINIAGNGDFLGIIWVIGAVEIKGTTDIRGSVFVQSGSSNQTTVLGNANLEYDAVAIQGAIGAVGTSGVSTPAAIAWKEI